MHLTRTQLGIATGFLFACASVPKPIDQIAQSEGAVRSASELGAADVPQAALSFQLAKEELEKAKALMKDDKNEEATQMVMRSRSDAELAVALTRQRQAQGDLHGVQDRLKSVQEKVQ